MGGIGQGTVDHLPEGSVVFQAYVFQHADRDEGIAGPADVPVVILNENHSIFEALVERRFACVGHLRAGNVV